MMGEKSLPQVMEDDKTRKIYFDLMHIGLMIKHSFKILLGSTYLDEEMEEVLEDFYPSSK